MNQTYKPIPQITHAQIKRLFEQSEGYREALQDVLNTLDKQTNEQMTKAARNGYPIEQLQPKTKLNLKQASETDIWVQLTISNPFGATTKLFRYKLDFIQKEVFNENGTEG